MLYLFCCVVLRAEAASLFEHALWTIMWVTIVLSSMGAIPILLENGKESQ